MLALVVSDQRMPGMHGTEVLTRIRAKSTRRRGAVLLTAYSDIDAAVKAINDAHLYYYLAKPLATLPEEKLSPGRRRSARVMEGGVPAQMTGVAPHRPPVVASFARY